MLHAQDWDSQIWLCGWYKATSTRNGDSRPMLRKVYTHTLEVMRDGAYRTESRNVVTLPDLRPMLDGSVMYSEPIQLPDAKDTVPTQVQVLNMDCILAGKELIDAGLNPALLNMASLYHPGGGVLDGSSAQEEDLCRRSTLAASLYQFSLTGGKHGDLAQMVGVKRRAERYPMDNRFGGIYSPDVTFIRSTRDEGYALLDEPYSMAVISVAALNYNPRHGHNQLQNGRIPEQDKPVLLDKIRTILRIGALHGHDSLVLGAFGCGVFCTPPAQMAQLFRTVLAEAEFQNRFRRVVFAILDTPNSNNFTPFRTIFQ